VVEKVGSNTVEPPHFKTHRCPPERMVADSAEAMLPKKRENLNRLAHIADDVPI
jgi:hypothetical protein